MIYISQDNLDEIEYLFDQSARGIHLLFEKSQIIEILKNPTEDIDFFSIDNIQKIQEVLSTLIEKKSLGEKEAYIRRLSPENHELLIRAYFNILENAMFESETPIH